ncbi:hypothetical protein GCM10010976_11180 [Bizionia arctica]|uniref:GxxExxY protein n=1 Tax=Bizionia arctica TaxID=1495645 RepID=A0A917GE85_9FLAO|nr:GxxExxY protein [Bizionia arctica]GGG41313.1 hypothetical protein GCM10010976_11180 [Bizionia arctica]
MTSLIYKEEAYKIIGICMEVHNQLGKGFNEIVYADALEIEFMDHNILYSREKKYGIVTKEIYFHINTKQTLLLMIK